MELNLNRAKMENSFATHYLNKAILFEVVKYGYCKEIAFLGDSSIRCVMAHKVSYLTKNFSAFGFFPEGKKIYNIYMTVAHIRDLGMFSFAPYVRKKEQEIFNLKFNSKCFGYDLVFDFDAKHCPKCGHTPMVSNYSRIFVCSACEHKEGIGKVLEKAKKDCVILKSILDRYDVSYFLKCSGSGFHVRIPYKNFEHKIHKANGGMFEINYCVEFCKTIGNTIKTIFNLETLDNAIYDSRRLWKIPYTLDIKTGNVALPLTDDQFSNFKPNFVNPKSREYIKEINPLSHFYKQENIKAFNKFYDEIIVG